MNYVEDEQEAGDSSSDQGDIPMHDEEGDNKPYYAMVDENGSFKNNKREKKGRVAGDV